MTYSPSLRVEATNTWVFFSSCSFGMHCLIPSLSTGPSRIVHKFGTMESIQSGMFVQWEESVRIDWVRAVSGQGQAQVSPESHCDKVSSQAKGNGKKAPEIVKKGSAMMRSCFGQLTPTLSPHWRQAGNQEAMAVVQVRAGEDAEQGDGQKWSSEEEVLLDGVRDVSTWMLVSTWIQGFHIIMLYVA